MLGARYHTTMAASSEVSSSQGELTDERSMKQINDELYRMSWKIQVGVGGYVGGRKSRGDP